MSTVQGPDGLRPEEPADKPLVLLVDDDLPILAALQRQLRGEPYDVVTASSAAEALASLNNRTAQVIVSDDRMPGTNGSELLAEVRDRWPWIGRVILTGYPGQDVMIRGLEVGVDFVLHKPWDGEALKKTLRRLVEQVDRSHPRSPQGTVGDGGVDVGGEGG